MATEKITITTSKGDDSRFVDKRRSNVKSDLIEITEDKLENILLKHLVKMELRKRWQVPLSFFVSVSLALTTADFRNVLGVDAPVWNALFILIAIASSIALSADLVRLYRCWKQTELEYLLRTIKAADGDG